MTPQRPTPLRALVIDADPRTRPLTTELSKQGFEVYAANRGRFAIPVGRSTRPDIVVLDLALPDDDGVETYDGLRAAGVDAPVLFLSGQDDPEAEAAVRRMMTEADGHVTKPFTLAHALAHLQELLARELADESRLLRIGSLTVDMARRAVWRDGSRVELSSRELELLRYLLDNAGQVVTKRQILERVWGAPFRSGIVETYVYYLRRKLRDQDQSLIRTVRGLGYTMTRG
ncbi:response regulator transcription factor [Streptomyces sp. LBL]|uniref:response regulator transcription factor n=1 Tax=Streptomyces sp. LBL TaxID=2940562 RepID=UPI00247410E0|nr:response regulator transcription factor [Streptomyces sp. LBL]